MDKPVKIILDTDIGTDIDDAVALAYLLKNEQCQLLGITTVTGEPEKRAMLADALCRVAGKNIPIHAGHAAPVSNIPQRQTCASHAAALEQDKCRKQFPSDTAVDFLKNTIRANPGEIILLSIGPLTNVAKLFSQYPDIPELLKAHYMMGGAFSRDIEKSEWNILCDPLAAKEVFDLTTKPIRAFGLDVTMQVKMPAEQVRKKFQSVILSSIMDSAEIFFKEQKRDMIFHDPLAAIAIFKPDICEMQRGRVEVIDETGQMFGKTCWTPAENGPHEIAVSVKSDEFFIEFFDKTT
jgi:inosine-uridine nucleoside N-ribohydrolase